MLDKMTIKRKRHNKADSFDIQVSSEISFIIQQAAKKIYPPMLEHVKKDILRPSGFPFCPLWEAHDIITKKEQKPLDFFGEYYTQIGTVTHAILQRHIGRSKKILGDWKCLKCKKTKKLAFYARCSKCGSEEVEYEELEVSFGKNILGHLDGVIEINGKNYVLDYKTTSSSKNKQHKEEGGVYPYKKNLAQIKSYCVLVQETHDIEISGWILLYIARDDFVKDCVAVGGYVSDEEKDLIKKKLENYDKMYSQLRNFRETKQQKYLDRIIKNKPCKTLKDYKNEFGDPFDVCPLSEKSLCFRPEALKENLASIMSGKKKIYQMI